MALQETEECAVVESVYQFNKATWTELFGDIPEGYSYHATLEASRMEGFDYCYIAIRRNNEIVLLAPLFASDLDLAIGLEGILRTAVEKLRRWWPRFLIEKTLYCGSPFGERGYLGISSKIQDSSSLVAALIGAMEEVALKKSLRLLLFKDFPADLMPLERRLLSSGFFRGQSFPNSVVPLPYGSMQAYLESLTSNARKDLRRKLRQSSAAGLIERKIVSDVSGEIDRVYELYLNTYQAGSVRFEKLTPDYFIQCGQIMAEQARFFMYYFEGRLVCFNLCFVHRDHLIDKFIGIDYSVAKSLNIYFYTWYCAVSWCIENGIRYYQVGQTDYLEKKRLGGQLIPLVFYAKHRNWVLQQGLRLASEIGSPHAA